MKKVFAFFILLSVVLAILVSYLIFDDSTTISMEPLPDEVKTKIRNRIIVAYDDYISWDASEKISEPYYGTINDCVIVQVTGKIRWDPDKWGKQIEIAGYTFETPDVISLYAYRNGEACTLADAYERDWLTKWQIGSIHRRHNEIYAEWIEEKQLCQSLFLLDGNVYERVISSSESREHAIEICTQEYSGVSTIVTKCELVYESDLLYGLHVTWNYRKDGELNSVNEKYVISFKKSIVEMDAIPIRINTKEEAQIEKVLLYLYFDKYSWHRVRDYQLQTTDKEYIMTIQAHYIQSHDWDPATHAFLEQTILVDRTTGEVIFDCKLR